MAIAFKKDAKVRQKIFVIEGSVASVAIVDDDVQYEVEYIGEDDEVHKRFFKESELEAAD